MSYKPTCEGDEYMMPPEVREWWRKDIIEITPDEAYTVIAFVKNFERDEIPEDLSDLVDRLCDEVFGCE